MLITVAADDFTGALDTGVQFSAAGYRVCVFAAREADWIRLAGEADVAVIDTESRHIPAPEAYARVRACAEAAKAAGSVCFFKKTDSVLRGNIGAELAAAADGWGGDGVVFAPAFPDHHRFTRGGVQYLDDTPVHLTPLGADPFEPLTTSDVAEIIRRQTELPVHYHPKREAPSASPKGIHLFDAQTDSDLQECARAALSRPAFVLAGCAGFARAVAAALRRIHPGRTAGGSFRLPQSILLVSGSINSVTLRQHRYCYDHGYQIVSLNSAQRLDPDYPESDACRAFLGEAARVHSELGHTLLEVTRDSAEKEDTRRLAQILGLSPEETRASVARHAAGYTERLIRLTGESVLVVFGGDTLIAVLQILNVSHLTPVCEISPGVVLSRVYGTESPRWIVSKSGGFGSASVVKDIEEFLKERR